MIVKPCYPLCRRSLSYFPCALQEIEQSGVLPNSEILAPSYDVSVLRDYVGAGNVVGEVGVLTGRRRDASVDCETAVQAYYISNQVMDTVWSPVGFQLLAWGTNGLFEMPVL